MIYGTMLLIGYRIARGFGAPRSVRLILGPVGLGVLARIAAATLVLFILADTAGTVTGLTSLPARSPRNAQLIELYAAAGRLYPAYIAACLLPATSSGLSRRFPAAIRWGAALLSAAFVAMILATFFPLVPSDAGYLKAVVNYTAVLILILGLTTIWFDRIRVTQAAARKSSTAK